MSVEYSSQFVNRSRQATIRVGAEKILTIDASAGEFQTFFLCNTDNLHYFDADKFVFKFKIINVLRTY